MVGWRDNSGFLVMMMWGEVASEQTEASRAMVVLCMLVSWIGGSNGVGEIGRSEGL